MSIKLQLPKLTDLKPRITVIGVGGAGGNAVNNMIASGLSGVEYIVANTDAQALAASSAERRIQLGVNLTEGLGAGSKPEIGEAAAEEAIEDIRGHIAGSHMVFIAAGMGGGTGTGAAAVIARAARDLDILTVGIVTKPFLFEGSRRMRTADAGIAELKKYVDTLIVIPNQNLFRIANEKTTFAEAFVLADQVLYSGIACIVDLIVKEGLINLDFADVRTVMSGMGTAMMGTGEATGERRAFRAAEEAISNPLLDEVSLKGAKGLLLSIIGGLDMTLYEVDEAASRVRQEVDAEANIIVGATFDENMGDRIRVAIVASGMSNAQMAASQAGVAGSKATSAFPPRSAGDVAMQQPAASASPPPPASHVDARHAHSAPYATQAPPMTGYAAAGNGSGSARQTPHGNREVWRAPGDVVIEEGLPAFSSSGIARTTPPPLQAAAPTNESFVPSPPADVQRPVRPMPAVDDFPPVGQREYRAKVGQYDTARPAPPAPRPYRDQAGDPPVKKAGLLQRLVGGGGRRDRESQSSRHDSADRANPESEDGARSGSSSPALPVFFNKNKR